MRMTATVIIGHDVMVAKLLSATTARVRQRGTSIYSDNRTTHDAAILLGATAARAQQRGTSVYTPDTFSAYDDFFAAAD